MRPLGILLLPVALAGCGDSAARWQADCEASQKLYAMAVSAMCSPWGEQRAQALGDVFEAARDGRFENEITGETITDYVSDLGPQDCIDAGFPNPGERVIDGVREAFHAKLSERIKETRKTELPKNIKISGRVCSLREGVNRDRKVREGVREFMKRNL